MDNQPKIEDFLLRDSENILRLPFKYKKWSIKPLVMAQIVKINPYTAKFAKDDLDDLQKNIEENRLSKTIEFQNKYAETMVLIVNTIVKHDISNEATPDDYMILLIGILYRLGGMSFLKSINLFLRLSLQSKAGLIAAEKRYVTSLESLSSQTHISDSLLNIL